MKKNIVLFLLIAMVAVGMSARKKTAFLSTFESLTDLKENGDDDEAAAADWFVNVYNGDFLPVSGVTSVNLDEYSAIWIAVDRYKGFSDFPPELTDPAVMDAIRNYYKNGGNLLLTNHATKYLRELGRVDQYPEVVGEVQGGKVPAIWQMLPTFGSLELNSSWIPVDRSSDPIYAGLTSLKTELWGKPKKWILYPMMEQGWKEDHNCLWRPRYIGSTDQGETFFDYKSAFDNFESHYNMQALACWEGTATYDILGIARWLPQGDYRGKAITIGIGCYEWHLNNRAIFMGNSITDIWGWDYPDFFSTNGYENVGIGGQVSGEMLDRFRSDVISKHPQCAVIMCGINDIAHNTGYAPTLEGIRDNIAKMATMARQNNIGVIICSVTPVDAVPWNAGITDAPEKVVALNALLKAYANENGIPYVDYHSLLKTEKNTLKPEYWRDGVDCVHVNAAGYRVMMQAVKPAIDDLLKTGNYKMTENKYQSNIEQLTRNALDELSGTYPQINNLSASLSFASGVYYDGDVKPRLAVTNNGTTPVEATMKLDICNERNELLKTVSLQATTFPAESTINVEAVLNGIAPGFYRVYPKACAGGYSVTVGRKSVFAYQPEQINVPLDRQPDFDQFWTDAKAELATVAPNFKAELLKNESNGTHNVYEVSMYSANRNVIKGYYTEPKGEGKVPAILVGVGYAGSAWILKDPQFAIFVYNIHSVGLSPEVPSIGRDNYISNGAGDKNHYFYRNAYLDAVRSVDFLVSRDRVRDDMIFAWGHSQGGALTLAIGALDERIKGIAPLEMFLSDFPGYFSIKANLTDENQWPLYEFSADIDRQNVSMNDALTNMSYVDNKNLAPYIKCPVYMFTGLQDAVCPPYTNFAVYNQITAPKHYTICPECEHNLGANTIEYVHNWFLSLMKDYDSVEQVNGGVEPKKMVVTKDSSDNISVNINDDTSGTLRLLDTLGRSVYLKKVAATESSVRLDRKNFAGGVYIVQYVSDKNYAESLRVVI